MSSQTVLTTTNTAITDVFSTTSTAFETDTSTVVITSTSTSTSSFTEFVSETVTETVPTSPGFLPAASTTPTAYPNADPPARKRFMSRGKEVQLPNVKRGNNNNGNGWGSAKYPQSVRCKSNIIFPLVFVSTNEYSKASILSRF